MFRKPTFREKRLNHLPSDAVLCSRR